MKKLTVYVATNKVGSRCSTTFEIEGTETEEDIEELAQEMMYEMIDWGFDVSDDGES